MPDKIEKFLSKQFKFALDLIGISVKATKISPEEIELQSFVSARIIAGVIQISPLI